MHIRLKFAATLAFALLMSPFTIDRGSGAHATDNAFKEIAQVRKRFEDEVKKAESNLQADLKAAAVEWFAKVKNANQQLQVATLNNVMANSRTGGLVNGRIVQYCADWARKAATEYESQMESACATLIAAYENALRQAEVQGDQKAETHLKRELARIIHFRDYQLLQPVDRCIAAFRLTADSAADWSIIAKAYSHEYRLNGKLMFPLTYAVDYEFASSVPGWEKEVRLRAQWPFTIQNLKAIAPETDNGVDTNRLLNKWAQVKTVATIRRTLISFGRRALLPQAQQYIREHAKDLYAMRFDLDHAFDAIDHTKVQVNDGGQTYTRDLTFGEELSQKLITGLIVKFQEAMIDAEAESQFLEYSDQVAQFEHQVWFQLQDVVSELPRSSDSTDFTITADYTPNAFPETLAIVNTTGRLLQNVVVLMELRFRDQVDPWVLGCYVQKWDPQSKVEVILPNQIAATIRPAARPQQLPIRLTIADGLQRFIDQPLVLLAGSQVNLNQPVAATLQLKPAAPLAKPTEFIQAAFETIQRHNACLRDNERFIETHVQNCLRHKRTYNKDEQKALAEDAKRVKEGLLPRYFLVGSEAKIYASRNRVLRELSLLVKDAKHQGCDRVAEALSSQAQAFTQIGALKTVALPSMQTLVDAKSQEALDAAKHFDAFITTIESRIETVEKQLLRKPGNLRNSNDNPEVQLDELRANGTLPRWCRLREKTALKSAIQKLDQALAELKRASHFDLDAEIGKLQRQLESMYGPLLAQLDS